MKPAAQARWIAEERLARSPRRRCFDPRAQSTGGVSSTHQWLKRNSRELSNAQKTSSSGGPGSFTPALRFDALFRLSVGRRLTLRRYNSLITCGGVFFSSSSRFNDAAFLHLRCDVFAVHQVQRLTEVRLHLHFAGANRFAGGPAERCQEIRAVLPSAICTARAPIGRPANLSLVCVACVDAIEQHFGPDSAQTWRGEVALVECVRVVGLPCRVGRCATCRYRATSLKVVLVFGEMLAPVPRAAGRCTGGLLTRTSSTWSTMPRPKKWAQTMLARFLAKYGLLSESQPLGQHFAAVVALDVGCCRRRGISAASRGRRRGDSLRRRPS